MKKYCAFTIVLLFLLTLTPGYAIAAEAVSSSETERSMTFTSPSDEMPTLTPDEIAKLYLEYTVKKGDSLFSISKQFSIKWRDIAELNGIRGPKYIIRIGQTLKIPQLPNLPGTTGNYLILCETETQKQSLAEFKTYKMLRGYTVTVKSVESDVKPKAGTDTSEAIRQYLKKMDQEMSLEYVLLVGSPFNSDTCCPQHTGGFIPMRYLYYNPDNHKTKYNYDWYSGELAFNTPSDVYYAFDFDWDYDKDGFPGEIDEQAESVKKAKPRLLFMLGRIPFSNVNDIKTVLSSTMQYEINRKNHSDALISSYGIWAYYGDALAKSFHNVKIEATTIFGNSYTEPSAYESTYPLSPDIFDHEVNKKYDFVYAFGDIARYSDNPFSGKDAKAGICFLDNTATMEVEPEPNSSRITAQDLLRNGSACAVIATTREVGFNPENPAPRMASMLFSNKTYSIAGEFYDAIQSSIINGSVVEAYINCYLGDPSIALKP